MPGAPRPCPDRVSTIVHVSASLRVRAVRCTIPAGECGAIEYAAASTLALPQRGVFIRYDAPQRVCIADRSHGVFFTADRPYRVRHPAPGGDDCLVLEPAPDALRELLDVLDPPTADRPAEPFRTSAILLAPRQILERRLLWQRLQTGRVDPLEIDARAHDLFASAVRQAAAPRPGRFAGSRGAALAFAAQELMAARPQSRWSLTTIAAEVGCSPFHLAHVFRTCLGLPIHQYLVRLRLAAALDAVLDDRLDLSRIALDNGFAHHSHFSASFRRAFGLSPSALRRHAATTRATAVRNFVTAAQRAAR